MNGVLTALRRVLSAEVSIADLLEAAMWLAIPYLVAGMAFTFTHPEYVQFFESQLATRLPAGADLAGFGQTTLLWPVLMISDHLCAA
ncbi:hypothetical protein NIIDNTM18_51780 [Mycolicibacterium litorale]|uniref:Uncharacterized protein n=1 Tax=Mycolicibacterium litorale TaxID=758802 RepID=A0A6S6PHC1_9MYCO|nr:hypothetical protein [Mycolicibacterium litorale]BCI55900.1 hypothetical protein NIIDNTM18_51780 [Mycolicibacterium litorale]